jgi:hypothetical protein
LKDEFLCLKEAIRRQKERSFEQRKTRRSAKESVRGGRNRSERVPSEFLFEQDPVLRAKEEVCSVKESIGKRRKHSFKEKEDFCKEGERSFGESGSSCGGAVQPAPGRTLTLRLRLAPDEDHDGLGADRVDRERDVIVGGGAVVYPQPGTLGRS